MSITPVGGASSVQGHAALAGAAKPESREAPGAAEHDGDCDEAKSQAPAAAPSVKVGQVNLKA